MLIPVKRFTAAKGRLAGLLDADAAGRARPAGWPVASSPPPRRCRCSSPATTTSVASWADGAGARGAVEPGPRSQRRRRRRAGDDRRQGLRPPRDRPQRHPAGPRSRPPWPRPARSRSCPTAVGTARTCWRCRSTPPCPASYGGGSFAPPPRAGDGRRATGSRCGADARLALDVDNPDDLAHPLLDADPAHVAANDPGQPPLSGRRPPWYRATCPCPASALAVGAHPDDVEFGAGGTLAKWAAAGCVVHHLVCTDGSKGTWDPSADLAELVARRQRRAARGRPPAGRRPAPARSCSSAGSTASSTATATTAERGRAGHPRAATRGRARPRSVEALPAPPRSPPRRLARVRRHRRRPRPALLPRARARRRTGPSALLLLEADEPTHVEDVERDVDSQARRARGAREPVRVDDARRRRRAARGVPPGSAPASPSSAARTASPRPRSFAPLIADATLGRRTGRAAALARRSGEGLGDVEIHSSAAGPRTSSATSSRWRRCVTSEAEVRAPEPPTKSPASSGPHVHDSPDGAASSTRTGVSSASGRPLAT